MIMFPIMREQVPLIPLLVEPFDVFSLKISGSRWPRLLARSSIVLEIGGPKQVAVSPEPSATKVGADPG